MAKEKVPKERPSACLPSGFPAMLRQAHPETPAHPALLGKPERDNKIKAIFKSNIVGANSFAQKVSE
jgi:hypothetical protein